MSEENVEIASRLYEQMSGGGFDAAWELVDPDLEWETSPNLPDAGVYKGRERVRAFLEEQYDVVWGGPPRVDIERTFDCGDDVLLFVRIRGHGSHTGIPLDVQIAQLVTLRDGKVVRVRVFPDRQEALEVAGLSA
jgi:ketosteroid isomerase-like protein